MQYHVPSIKTSTLADSQSHSQGLSSSWRPIYMRVFVPRWLSSWDGFISVSGHFLVAVYPISFWDEVIPVLSTGMKRGKKCHVNDLRRLKFHAWTVFVKAWARWIQLGRDDFLLGIAGQKHSCKTKILSSRDETHLGPHVNRPWDTLGTG